MTRNYTRFIPGEEIEDVEQVRFGPMDTASLRRLAQIGKHEVPDHSTQIELGRQEGFADGFTQGHAKATLEAQRQIDEFLRNQKSENARTFVKLFESARSQLESAEQVIAQGVLSLACELAKKVLRQELSVNPKVLQPVIRDALDVLMGDGRSARITLNPLELESLQESIRPEFPEYSITFSGDEAIARGGCLVESAGTVVDGTVEKRWMRAVASLGLDAPWDELPHEH
jgi:flagellar assembly protein FliH